MITAKRIGKIQLYLPISATKKSVNKKKNGIVKESSRYNHDT